MKPLMWLAIGAGGAVGALLRYGIGTWVQAKSSGEFPTGTLLVNILGCFLFGLLFPIFGSGVSRELRLLLFTGLLGGFTTFSTFGFESVNLLSKGQTGMAFGYIAASVVLGLGATWLGLTLTPGGIKE